MSSTRRVLEVWWEDAFSHEPWADKSEVDTIVRQPCTSVTVGIEMSSTPAAIVLSTSMNVEGHSASVWRIPRGMVRKVRVLGRLTPPAKTAA